jgi:hypothetical protein
MVVGSSLHAHASIQLPLKECARSSDRRASDFRAIPFRRFRRHTTVSASFLDVSEMDSFKAEKYSAQEISELSGGISFFSVLG